MLEKFARYPLTFGPTPIEKLNRLGVHLGGKVELYTILPATSCSAALGGRRQAGRRRLRHRHPQELGARDRGGQGEGRQALRDPGRCLDAVGFSKDGRAPRVIGIDASATPKQTKAQGLEIARKWRPLSSGSGPARRRSRRNDGTAWGGRYFLIATSIVARQVNSTRL
jgi:hypothetical protein